MYEINIEEWEKESGHYLAPGRKLKNLNSGIKYEIEQVSISGITLKEIPYFKNQQRAALEIDYTELLNAFQEDIFAIEGFEAGQSRYLIIAINSLRKKIQIIDQQKKIAEGESELQKIKSEKHKRTEEEETKRRQKEEAKRLRIAEAESMQTSILQVSLTLEE